MADWARIVMNQRTDHVIRQLDHGSLDALELSGNHWSRFPWRTFRELHYPQFDICREIDHDRLYDVIFAEQVFEHLTYPYRAARNVWRMLKPGGYFVITTPFLLKIHNHPVDCSRWTPVGMRYFLEEAGFDRDATYVDSWGNRACINANYERWADYVEGLHSLENEPDFPIVVWAISQKPKV